MCACLCIPGCVYVCMCVCMYVWFVDQIVGLQHDDDALHGHVRRGVMHARSMDPSCSNVCFLSSLVAATVLPGQAGSLHERARVLTSGSMQMFAYCPHRLCTFVQISLCAPMLMTRGDQQRLLLERVGSDGWFS
jgi:hypothetical protein